MTRKVINWLKCAKFRSQILFYIYLCAAVRYSVCSDKWNPHRLSACVIHVSLVGQDKKWSSGPTQRYRELLGKANLLITKRLIWPVMKSKMRLICWEEEVCQFRSRPAADLGIFLYFYWQYFGVIAPSKAWLRFYKFIFRNQQFWCSIAQVWTGEKLWIKIYFTTFTPLVSKS